MSMGCKIYIDRFDYSSVERGQRKKAESRNGLEVLRYALGSEFGLDLSALTIERGEHGKPYFKENIGIHFNISHSGDYAAAAVCEKPVGVDVQVVRSVRENVVTRICDETELRYIGGCSDASRAFIRLWALKESFVKATGTGMSFPLGSINFDLNDFDKQGRITGRFSNIEGLYCLHDFGRFVLAACVL